MDEKSNKTQAIRDALKTCGRPMSLDELRAALEERMKQIINKHKLYTLLSVMIADKELGSVGYADGRFYWFRRAA